MLVASILWSCLLICPETLASDLCTGTRFGNKVIDPNDPRAYFVCLGVFGHVKNICNEGFQFSPRGQLCIVDKRLDGKRHDSESSNINIKQDIKVERPIIFNIWNLLWNGRAAPQHPSFMLARPAISKTESNKAVLKNKPTIPEATAIKSLKSEAKRNNTLWPSSFLLKLRKIIRAAFENRQTSSESESPSSTYNQHVDSSESNRFTSENLSSPANQSTDASNLNSGDTSSTENSASTSEEPSSTADESTLDQSTDASNLNSGDASSTENSASTLEEPSSTADESALDQSTDASNLNSGDASSTENSASTSEEPSSTADESALDQSTDASNQNSGDASSTENSASTSEESSFTADQTINASNLNLGDASSTENSASTSEEPSSTAYESTLDQSTDASNLNSGEASSTENSVSTSEEPSSTADQSTDASNLNGGDTENSASTSEDPSSTADQSTDASNLNSGDASSTESNESTSVGAESSVDSSAKTDDSTSQSPSANPKPFNRIAKALIILSQLKTRNTFIQSSLQSSAKLLPEKKLFAPALLIDNQNPDCSKLMNGAYIRDSKDCSKFYVCANERAIHRQCPRNLYFDMKRKVCNFPSYVDCSTDDTMIANIIPNPKAYPSKAQAEILSSQDCSSMPNGAYIRDLNECSKFYICANGRAIQKQCPRGLYFDIKSKFCNFPSLVNCFDKMSASSQKIGGKSEATQPDCNDKLDGTSMRDSKLCNKYYICLEGKAVSHYCKPGKWFDIDRQTCAMKQFVQCTNA